MSEQSLVTTKKARNYKARENSVARSKNTFQRCNKAIIKGIAESDFIYSHTVWEQRFYKTRVKVERLSGVTDYVPVIASERLIAKTIKKSFKGKYVEITGEFRSYDSIGEDNKLHLIVFLFASSINIWEDEEKIEDKTNKNFICLEGFICKTPVFKKNRFGSRVTQIILAVKRTPKRHDYIPCIAWEKYARESRHMKVGDKIRVYGRIQSRYYFKKSSPKTGEGEIMITYEISIVKMERI